MIMLICWGLEILRSPGKKLSWHQHSTKFKVNFPHLSPFLRVSHAVLNRLGTNIWFLEICETDSYIIHTDAHFFKTQCCKIKVSWVLTSSWDAGCGEGCWTPWGEVVGSRLPDPMKFLDWIPLCPTAFKSSSKLNTHRQMVTTCVLKSVQNITLKKIFKGQNCSGLSTASPRPPGVYQTEACGRLPWLLCDFTFLAIYEHD